MPRFGLPTATPSPEKVDGDESFVALDMQTQKEYLPMGYYSNAVNKRTMNGAAMTRRGTQQLKWANIIPYSQILGTGLFSNPNGLEMRLVATPNEVIGISDASFPTVIGLPTGVTLQAPCEFSQQFDKVLLHRGTGAGKDTLVWDGIGPAFTVMTRLSPTISSLTKLPNIPWSINTAGRCWFVIPNASTGQPSSLVGASQINDFTEYDATFNVYEVNTGTSDQIVGLFPFALNKILVGKGHSWDLIDNATGSLGLDSTGLPISGQPQVSVQTLSTEVGLAARKTARMVGGDMVFLDLRGVYRISQIEQDRLATSAIPVASTQDQFGNIVDPIMPLLNRINWEYISTATATVVSPYYYLAVPIDGSTVPNAVLVYNNVKDKWESYDTWGGSAVPAGIEQWTVHVADDPNYGQGGTFGDVIYINVAIAGVTTTLSYICLGGQTLDQVLTALVALSWPSGITASKDTPNGNLVLTCSTSVFVVVDAYGHQKQPSGGGGGFTFVTTYMTLKEVSRYQAVTTQYALQLNEIYFAKFNGRDHVFAVDTATNIIYVLYEGLQDWLANNQWVNIADVFETRGYAVQAGSATFKRVEIGIATHNPSINVYANTSHAFDSRILNMATITKDPTKYNIFGKPNYVITNVNNDFSVRGRKDYTCPVDGYYLGSGIDFDLKEQSVMRFALMIRGRWVSYQISNTQGQCYINGILNVAAEARERARSEA